MWAWLVYIALRSYKTEHASRVRSHIERQSIQSSSMAEELARQLGVSEGSLRAGVSETHLLEIATFVSWKDVGPRLSGIKKKDIDDIGKDGHDQSDKRSRLVDLWQERNGFAATYHAMITAMLAAKKRGEAESVCRLLASGEEGKCSLNHFLYNTCTSSTGQAVSSSSQLGIPHNQTHITPH